MPVGDMARFKTFSHKIIIICPFAFIYGICGKDGIDFSCSLWQLPGGQPLCEKIHAAREILFTGQLFIFGNGVFSVVVFIAAGIVLFCGNPVADNEFQ